MSAQSLGRAAQSGLGRFTRKPVSWLGSATVERSLGNGVPTTSTAASAAGGMRTSSRRTIVDRTRDERIDVLRRVGALLAVGCDERRWDIIIALWCYTRDSYVR